MKYLKKNLSFEFKVYRVTRGVECVLLSKLLFYKIYYLFDLTPCILVLCYQRFEETCYLNHQEESSALKTKSAGSSETIVPPGMQQSTYLSQ
jgi:hypothetical protein